jgi:hypothetical protein
MAAIEGATERVVHSRDSRPRAPQESDLMEQSRRGTVEAEPMGIIISRGSRSVPAPKFSAYVWGPVPEEVGEETSKAA